MAQVVLGVAGGAAGFFLTGGSPQGALIGFSVGMALGAPAMKVPGAKLGEIAKITAREGDPRVIVWGRVRPIGGNLVAVQDPRIVKKKKKSGGKGGGGTTTTTTTIFRTYAVGVCEGPITGFIRIWRNNKQVYDGRPGNAWGAQNNPTFLAKAKLYLGKYDQLPDAALEAVFGVGNVPAMRGTAYIRLADEDLTDMGGAVPQWLFEVERYQFAAPILPIPDLAWVGVAHSGVSVAAVASSGSLDQVMLADDGFHWISQVTPEFTQWQAIEWSGVNYVAIALAAPASGKQVMTSPDGQTWTMRATPGGDIRWQAICKHGGRMIVIASNHNVMTSDDHGLTWTLRTGLGPDNTWQSIASDGSTVVAVGRASTTHAVETSTDGGVTWSYQNSPTFNNWDGLCYGDKFIAVSSDDPGGTNTQVMVSETGGIWTAKPTPSAVKAWVDAAWNGTVYCAIALSGDVAGNLAMTSSDGGDTWVLQTTPASGYEWRAITAYGTLFVAVGYGGGIQKGVMTSADNGVTWVLGGA